MKIKVALLESDTNYLSRIVSVFNSRFPDKLEVYSFTDEETALDTIAKSKLDVLVASEDFHIEEKKLSDQCGLAYFVDSADIESLYKQRAICKFQKAELIYKEILGVYSDLAARTSGIKLDDDGSVKIMTFVSASGGVGSSTVAAACAVSMAKKGKKVLYLNLEQFGDSTIFFHADGAYDFGDVIYAIKSKKSNMALKLESFVKQDESGVYFYASCKIALDLMELTKDEIRNLIQDLTIYGGYDVIVIDVDFIFDGSTMEIFKQSHHIIFISDGSEISNNKFERAYKAVSVYEEQDKQFLRNRMSIFYNRFSSKTGKHANIELHELGGAPVFKQATIVQIIEQLSNMDVFHELV